MRPEGGEQPTQRLNAPGARRPVGSPTGPAPRPVGSPQRPAVQTFRGRSPTKRRRRRWSVKRILLTALAVIAVYVTAVATVFATSVTKIDALPVSSISSSGTNYLLVGSDSRVGLSAKEQKRLHTGSTEGQRTDTIMIMHVPLIGRTTLVSIPRDSWVGIPATAKARSTPRSPRRPAADDHDGRRGNRLTHRQLREIGFAGVADTTDALGGVRFVPRSPLQRREQRFEGEEGLSDHGRPGCAGLRPHALRRPARRPRPVERQQEFMSAVAKRAMSPITWLLPWRAFGAASAAGGSLTVDKSTGIFDDARLAVAMGMISMGMGDATTVPTVDGSYYVGGQDAVKWDTPEHWSCSTDRLIELWPDRRVAVRVDSCRREPLVTHPSSHRPGLHAHVRAAMLDHRDRAIETIHTALDAGVNLLDTANIYAPMPSTSAQRAIAAEAVRTYSGLRPLIATKGGITREPGEIWGRAGRRDALMSAAIASAKRLEVDIIDLYYLHRADPAVRYDEQIQGLVAVKEAGLASGSVFRTSTRRCCSERFGRRRWAGRRRNRRGPEREVTALPGRLRRAGHLHAREGIAYLPWSPLTGSELFAEHAAMRGVSPQRLTLAWLLGQSPVVIRSGSTRPQTILDPSKRYS